MDEDELRAFVARDYGRVVASVALITGDRASAEDAVQDALVKAWRRDLRLASLAGWVAVVAANDARSGLRRRKSEDRALERLQLSTPDVAAEGAGSDVVDVARALAKLSRRQREVAVLHYYLALTVAEVAAALGVSQGTVKTMLHRARAALASALGEGEREGVHHADR